MGGRKRIVIHVSGLVQGVFYRHSARLQAERRGITGWVRNEPDGPVSIIAEGEEEALKEFLEWCRKGTPFAKVDNVEYHWRKATREFRRFEIL